MRDTPEGVERGGRVFELLSLSPHPPRDTVQRKSTQEPSLFKGLWYLTHTNSQAWRAEILLIEQ
jgi:hypothetical protein